jgi:PAS domain S-box-containing protein
MLWPVLTIGDQVFATLSSVLLLWGAYEFFGKKVSWLWRVLTVLVALWVVGAVAGGLSYKTVTFPVAICLGLINVWIGLLFLWRLSGHKIGKSIVGAAFLLWGCDRFVYPLVWSADGLADGLASWYFITTAVMELVVAIGTLLIFFQRARDGQNKVEHRYRKLVENAGDMIYRYQVGNARGFEYVNPAATLLTGYAAEEFYADPDLFEKLLVPSMESPSDRGAEVATEVPHLKPLCWRRKDGRVIWVERVEEPLKDSAENTLMIQGVVRDVTQHLQATQDLRESEGRYRSLVEVSPEAIAVFSRGVLAYINPTGVEIFRAPDAQSLQGRGWKDLLQKNLWDAIDRNMSRGGRLDVPSELHEGKIHTLDGCVRDVEVAEAAVTYDGQEAIQIVFSDITERKLAEQAQVFLTTAVEQAVEAIVITGTDGLIQYVNPGFERMTGYSRDEAVGRNPCFLKSGEHDEAYYREMWKTLSAGQVWKGRLVDLCRDGTLCRTDVAISPVRDKSGQTISYVAVSRDVSQEVELEEQLRQVQKMEAIGQLAGGVAHDFNNLLTVITCYAEIVKENLEQDDQPVEDIEEVVKAARRAADLTRQLLAFSRRQILTPRVIDLNDVISEMQKMLRRLIREEINLEMIPGENLGLVKADTGQIEQVIVNLVINARDAIAQKGWISVETRNIELDIQKTWPHPDLKPGCYVMIKVVDTGSGMSPSTKERIFDPFFTTKKVGQGVGLGLATVYGIIKQHDGHITVDSELGHGTCFRIFLPRIKAGSGASKPATKEQRLRGGHETVLVAEDEPEVRGVAVRILQNYGYHVLATGDGVEALEVAQAFEGKIHLLLTDVVMPKMDGKTLADRLKELRPEVKIIFATGYADERIAKHGVLESEALLVQKPYNPIVLVREVRNVLDGNRSTGALDAVAESQAE